MPPSNSYPTPYPNPPRSSASEDCPASPPHYSPKYPPAPLRPKSSPPPRLLRFHPLHPAHAPTPFAPAPGSHSPPSLNSPPSSKCTPHPRPPPQISTQSHARSHDRPLLPPQFDSQVDS